MSIDMTSHIEGVDWTITTISFREKPSARSVIGTPVLSEDVQGILGKDSVTIRTILGVCDMYAHILAADIVIAKPANFTDTQSG